MLDCDRYYKREKTGVGKESHREIMQIHAEGENDEKAAFNNVIKDTHS